MHLRVLGRLCLYIAHPDADTQCLDLNPVPEQAQLAMPDLAETCGGMKLIKLCLG